MAGAGAGQILAVGSGKGGVGKTTVSVNLAIALAESGARVGLLDADIYGPNVPLFLGLARHKEAKSLMLWRNPEVGGLDLEPVERYGIKVVSTGFIVAESQALTMSGPLITLLIRQLLTDVDWGDLDYLVIDLPPGTGEVQQQLLDTLPLSAALVVVTPQDVAHLDARRAVEAFEQAGVRVLGGVENMSGLVCPHCATEIEVFPPVRDDRSVWGLGVERLVSVPLHRTVGSDDGGRPAMVADRDTSQAWAFRWLASRVRDELPST